MDEIFEAWKQVSAEYASSYDGEMPSYLKEAIDRTLTARKEEAIERFAATAGRAGTV